MNRLSQAPTAQENQSPGRSPGLVGILAFKPCKGGMGELSDAALTGLVGSTYPVTQGCAPLTLGFAYAAPSALKSKCDGICHGLVLSVRMSENVMRDGRLGAA